MLEEIWSLGMKYDDGIHRESLEKEKREGKRESRWKQGYRVPRFLWVLDKFSAIGSFDADPFRLLSRPFFSKTSRPFILLQPWLVLTCSILWRTQRELIRRWRRRRGGGKEEEEIYLQIQDSHAIGMPKFEDVSCTKLRHPRTFSRTLAPLTPLFSFAAIRTDARATQLLSKILAQTNFSVGKTKSEEMSLQAGLQKRMETDPPRNWERLLDGKIFRNTDDDDEKGVGRTGATNLPETLMFIDFLAPDKVLLFPLSIFLIRSHTFLLPRVFISHNHTSGATPLYSALD